MREYSLIEIIAEVYKFIKKYFLVILAFAIIGIIYGFYQKRNSPIKYYEAKIYVGTGLVYNARSFEPNINALYTDLLGISGKIGDTAWVKSYFNEDSTTFILMSVNNKSLIKTRFQNLLEITLRAKSYEDFPKFKRGLLYYYKHRSPLRSLYKQQQRARRELKSSVLKKALQNTLPVIDTQIVGVIFSSNIYDIYLDADISLARPLIYYTSDFSKITQKRSEQNLGFYLFAFILIGIVVSLAIELFIRTKNYLKEEKNKKTNET